MSLWKADAAGLSSLFSSSLILCGVGGDFGSDGAGGARDGDCGGVVRPPPVLVGEAGAETDSLVGDEDASTCRRE